VIEILEALDLHGAGAGGLRSQDGRALGARAGAGWRGMPVSVRLRPRVDAFAGKDRGVGRSLAREGPRRRLPPVAGGDRPSGLGAHDEAGRGGGEAALARERGRRTRPWTVEPGLWMQWDFWRRAEGRGSRVALIDDERTVWLDHVYGVAVRNPRIVSVGRHSSPTHRLLPTRPGDRRQRG
jgi:hypothetical protein